MEFYYCFSEITIESVDYNYSNEYKFLIFSILIEEFADIRIPSPITTKWLENRSIKYKIIDATKLQ